MSQLLAQIKQEIGDDAIILSSRQISESMIEVSVGLDQAEQAPLRAPMADVADESELEAYADDAIIPLDEAAIVVGRSNTTAASLKTLLGNQGLNGALASQLITAAKRAREEGQSIDRQIAAGLSAIFGFESRIAEDRKFIAFVGPTGVGKTTTIAKLAARMQAAFQLKIGLISTDSYRVGAGFHLQTYANLMNLPFKMVEGGKNARKDLEAALRAFDALDLVFIDTAGCSAREAERIGELEALFRGLNHVEKIMTLAAPSNDVDVLAAARAFQRVGYDRITLTKLDESAFIGPVLNTVHKVKKPLSFLATGQRVPEDIEPASARRLGWMLARAIH